jgi:hypothetical protein
MAPVDQQHTTPGERSVAEPHRRFVCLAMINLRRVLDNRNYRVYRLRTEQNKSFREIGAVFGVTGMRARQLYEAIIMRIELKKAGGKIHPEYCLSVRALNRIHWTFQKIDVTKAEIVKALKTGKLHPDQVYGYGWKTHCEVCKWAGVAASK